MLISISFFASTKSTYTGPLDSIKEKKVQKEIFGFHPYWHPKSYGNYRFDLLSDVSYFSYKLNPKTGNYLSVGDWKTTGLVNVAKENNCKVYLTITNMTYKSNSLFLNNKKAINTSIINIMGMVNFREADGVTLNFENIYKKDIPHYISYVKKISKTLKKNNKLLTITLPATNCLITDLNQLNKYVHRFLVMGYNYNGGEKFGGVAPLNNLKFTINYYLSKGVSKDKFILVLPYYGSEWVLDNDNKTSKFSRYLSYKIIKDLTMMYPVEYDRVSKVAYINYKKDNLNYTIIFDDAKTLGEKYDYVISKDLIGIGIWALGYDDSYVNLWNVLDEKFTRRSNTNKTVNTEEVERDVWIIFIENDYIKKFIFFILFFVVNFGFIISLRHIEVRKVLFMNRKIRLPMLALLPICISVLFWYYGKDLIDFLNNFPLIGKGVLIIFLIAGILYGYTVYKIMNDYEENEHENTP